MKKFLMGVVSLVTVCSMAVGQKSLLNEATNGLFYNVNDFVIKPNIMFNTVETKQVIIGGGFDNLGFESNAQGGGLIGYYHPGSFRWSVAGLLNMRSGNSNHTVRTETTNDKGDTIGSVEHKNPAFAQYEGGIRFTFGLPETLNLSAGVMAYFKGDGINNYETTTTSTKNNETTETTTIKAGTKNFHMTFGIPIGIEFTSEIYNYLEPLIFIDETTTITGTNPDDKKEETETEAKFMLYDKLSIQSLLPAPFDSETGFWVGIGNFSPHLVNNEIIKNLSELEQQSYNISSVTYDVKFVSQLGAYSMMDFSVAGIELKFKPMVYFDFLLGSHKSVTFGTTVAAAAGVYAPLGNLPLALFFGVTPALQFYTTSANSEAPSGRNTIRTEATSRVLATNVLWSGKVGTSILLPKDMALDVTLDVDSSVKSLGLSAQMSIAL